MFGLNTQLQFLVHASHSFPEHCLQTVFLCLTCLADKAYVWVSHPSGCFNLLEDLIISLI